MGKKALLLIDVQNDFCTGGNLAVPNGEEIVPVINKLMSEGDYDLIAASLDWHPQDHGSFVSQHPGKKVFETGELSGQPQIIWPDHCVQGTKGAEFHPDLDKEKIDHIQTKGTDKTVDSYSAFRDNMQDRLTGLSDYLQEQGITELHICGLATDVCVKFSLLDAAELLPGVKIVFVEDASRGLSEDAVNTAKQEISAAGIDIRQAAELLPEKPRPAICPRPPKQKKFGR